MKWPSKVFIYTDGASRGNPGPASIGVYITDSDSHVCTEFGETLGHQTNNFAEYTAVVRGLQTALDNQVGKIILKSDSQLLIRQLLGQYRVKKATLIPLFKKCKELLSQFESFQLEHIPRELNQEADRLANQALDHNEVS